MAIWLIFSAIFTGPSGLDRFVPVATSIAHFTIIDSGPSHLVVLVTSAKPKWAVVDGRKWPVVEKLHVVGVIGIY